MKKDCTKKNIKIKSKLTFKKRFVKLFLKRMNLNLLQKGGEIHKKVQEYTKNELLKSGVLLWDLTKSIETKIQDFTNYSALNPLDAGIAFPTGVSLNNCAAHWTPNPKDKYQILSKSDIIKVDFGVHLNGWILDGAFSYTENPDLFDLIECSVDATDTGISLAGVDAILGDIGTAIEEVINSYEVTIKNKVYPVVSTYDLCGHQIGQYKIHAGKAVPNVKIRYPLRMKANEEYAIETFPSTGSGKTIADNENTSHYMIDTIIEDTYKLPVELRSVYNDLVKRFGTLAFCKRWLNYNDDLTMDRFNTLVKKQYVKEYPPLYDLTTGSYVAQTERSIYLSSDERKYILN